MKILLQKIVDLTCTGTWPALNRLEIALSVPNREWPAQDHVLTLRAPMGTKSAIANPPNQDGVSQLETSDVSLPAKYDLWGVPVGRNQ
jgi:hypothetical protein